MAAGDFFFSPWVLLLISRKCHDEFFIHLNFFHDGSLDDESWKPLTQSTWKLIHVFTALVTLTFLLTSAVWTVYELKSANECCPKFIKAPSRHLTKSVLAMTSLTNKDLAFPSECSHLVGQKNHDYLRLALKHCGKPTVPCLKLLISKVLGYGIIAGSLMVKIPQIIKVVKAGNTEGLSIMSFYFELLAYTINYSYNLEKGFPFSTWGESLFISIQTIILILLCYYYSGVLAGALIFSVMYSFLVYVLISGLTPIAFLTKLLVAVLPIMALSKVFQIIENLRNGHTGQLSGITVFLNFAGCLARVFTTYHETGDMILLINVLVSLFLNGTLFFQIIYYWNKHPMEKLKKTD